MFFKACSIVVFLYGSRVSFFVFEDLVLCSEVFLCRMNVVSMRIYDFVLK